MVQDNNLQICLHSIPLPYIPFSLWQTWQWDDDLASITIFHLIINDDIIDSDHCQLACQVTAIEIV